MRTLGAPPERLLSAENRMDGRVSRQASLMDTEMLHKKEEREIASEPLIDICPMRWACLRRSSPQSPPQFQSEEQSPSAALPRGGQLHVPQICPRSTGRPRVGSGPGGVPSLASEIRRAGLLH